MTPSAILIAAAPAIVFVALAASPGARAWSAAAAQRRPYPALWLVSVLATLAACYPVVFCGKSFVSPNITALLHQAPPTVPGYADRRMTDLHVGDPAAALWQNVPYSVAEHEAIVRDHELPLWNRYSSCGITLLGQGQSMLGDPLHLLTIAAGGASWAWDAKYVLARLLFAAGIALTVLTLSGDVAAASLATVAAAFVGFFNYRFNHPAVFSVSYAPWILCSWASLTRAVNLARVRGPLLLLVLANTAVLGSGTVKEAYALLLILNATGAAFWLLAPATTRQTKLRTGAAIAVTGACWLAITAPLWLIFFDALGSGTTSYDTPAVLQAPRAWVVGLFDTLFYVELTPKYRIPLPSANFLVLIGVAFAACQSPRRLWKSPPLFTMLGAASVCVLFGFGFVPGQWIAAVPLLRNVYHVHNTFGVVAVVLLCVIAGGGFHVARFRLAQPHAWRPIAIAATALLVLLAAYFQDGGFRWHDAAAGTSRSTHAFFYVNIGLMLAACAALTFIAWLRVRRRHCNAVMILVSGAAVLVLLYRHGLQLDLGFAQNYLTVPMVRAELTTASPAIEAAKRDAAGEPFRLVGTDATLIPAFNTVYGIEGINGPDAIMNGHYRELGKAAGVLPPTDWLSLIATPEVPRLRPVLDFLGVRYLISDGPTLAPDAGYRLAGRYDMALYRSDTAWPRVFFVDRVTTYGTVDDLVAMIRSTSGPFAAVQVGEGDAPHLPAPTSAIPVVVAARDYRLASNRIAFSVSAPSAGVVVLTETWSRGDFHVTLNGRATPYFRINHAFKGVVVPGRGEYRMVVSYWPRHLTTAFLLAVTGILGFVLLLVGLSARELSS